MRRWLFLIPMALVVAAEFIAYQYGWISEPLAVGIFVALETLIAGIALHRDKNHPVRKLIATEQNAWLTLFLLIRGKSEHPAGATPLYGQQGWYQLPAMFTVAIIVEIIVIELLIPISWLRLVLLVLSVYSLLLLWALFAGPKVHPSFIHHDKLVLRFGRKVIATIPLDQVASVSRQRGFSTDLHLAKGDTLTLGSTAGTNTTVTLKQPIQLQATGYFWQHRPMLDIKQCHLWLDDPDSLIILK